MADSQSRQKAYRLGRFSENLCLWTLRLKGYRILVRGFKEKTGEIDIIAKHGKVIVFIEVKARQSLRAASEAITPTQQQRITRSAEAYIIKNPIYADYGLRFDAMYVLPQRFPIHIKDAWRPGF